MTTDLITWLRAQLDEDERIAQNAPPGNWAIWLSTEAPERTEQGPARVHAPPQVQGAPRMTEPEITVHKLSYFQPVVLLGLDDQGRQTYRCPSAGCGETAYFDEEGRGHCPTDEMISEFLRDAFDQLLPPGSDV